MAAVSGPKPVVLSADDDENAHLLLTRAFSKSGTAAKLTTLLDGTDVVRYLSGEGEYSDRSQYPWPDLLLLDLKMTKMSGFEVLQYIQQQPGLPEFPVIVFSASDNDGDKRRARELGCHSYIVKPVDFGRLLNFVRSLDAEFFTDATKGRGVWAAQPVIPLSEMNSQSLPPKEVAPKLVESPDMFRLLVEQVKDYAIFMLDAEGYIRSWNEGARRLKGYESHEVIGKHFSIFYPMHDIEADKPGFELRMATEMGRYEDEGWRLRKDRSRFWANVIVTPLRDKNGKLSGFAKVTRDLTQKKLEEQNMQRLLESEERFRLLVEQVRDYAIFMLDAKGNIATWNQGARRLKGYSADEILGKHFSEFYTPEDKAIDHPSKELAMAIRDGRYEEEGWRVKKDGTRFWASVTITSIWDKRGNLTGFAKVTRDLTERKQIEDALRSHNEELEVFAQTLSHDLRAPLRSIGSFAEILKSDSAQLSEEEKESYLEKILRSAAAMNSMVNNVLRISRVSNTQVPMETVDLDKVFEDVLTLSESEIKSAHAKVKVSKALGLASANTSLLVQVFCNIFGTVLEGQKDNDISSIDVSSREKEGELEIDITVRTKPNSAVKIEEGRQSSDDIGMVIVRRALERVNGTLKVRHGQKGENIFAIGLQAAADDSSPMPDKAASKSV